MKRFFIISILVASVLFVSVSAHCTHANTFNLDSGKVMYTTEAEVYSRNLERAATLFFAKSNNPYPTTVCVTAYYRTNCSTSAHSTSVYTNAYSIGFNHSHSHSINKTDLFLSPSFYNN